MGRLVIPAKLRAKMDMTIGELYTFFEYVDEQGHRYLAIQCPDARDEVAEARAMLEKAGYKVEPRD